MQTKPVFRGHMTKPHFQDERFLVSKKG
uniref:Uncharacterized protein n=1 Tax=Arundo donax TaxID=35708 RepID=A0A0A8ZT34_ARUDO